MMIGEATMLDLPEMGATVGPVPAHRGPMDDFDLLFRQQFASMVRLAHLLGSDDPENTAQ